LSRGILAFALALFAAGLVGCAASWTTDQPPAEIGSVSVSPKDGMTMVYVPAGDFLMGSEKGLTDEQPQHEVYLDAYWIDQTEITNAMYRECVGKGKCELPYSTVQFDDPKLTDHPVVFVSWVKAKEYCTWAGRRLPTEAEWEKAAIWDVAVDEQRVYPWGNEYDCAMGNFDDELELDASIMPNTPEGSDGFVRTAPVGSFPAGASPCGVLDMGGNVWEWVHDAFLEVDPLTTTVTNYYAISPRENPQGVDPALTDYRVVRGGSWSMLFGFGRGAYRLWYGLDDAYEDIGFRCAMSASP
jgi:eukaryotic-like serine/threonine-protein kinase